MTCGIYKLNFNGTNKVYIGQSENIENRFNRHIRELKSNNHSVKMNQAYITFGLPEYTILAECSTTDLNEFENETIEIYNAVDNGFNTCYKAEQLPISYGELNGNAKFSNSQIEECFNLLVINTELSFSEISNITKVSVGIIGGISRGSSHMWLSREYPEKYNILINLKGNRKPKYGDKCSASKISNELVIKLLDLLIDDRCLSLLTISEDTGISYNIVRAISSGETHKWLAEAYPDKYTKLVLLKGTRYSKANSAVSRGIVYPRIISPDGVIYTVDNASQFSRLYSLDTSSLCKVLKGSKKHHKGWRICPEEQV